MAVSEQTGDGQNTVEELQKEVNEWKTKYENLDRIHGKLKDDHRDLKATSGDAANLQQQVDRAVADKSKLMREKDELQQAFDGYKQEVQKKELKQHLTTALEAAGAKNASTAMKLLDLDAVKFDEQGNVIQQSVADAINAIQTSDPVLFWQEGENTDPKSGTTTSTTTTSTSTTRPK